MPTINTSTREYRTAQITLVETISTTDGGNPVVKVTFEVKAVSLNNLTQLRTQLADLLDVVDGFIG